ncbi:hypothetical protein [Sulfuriflexus mobilis]|uniref:hypothetical protein n=1 Tax=Sulfuriflexus mobilis TaxID=1811807 RepID=UPI000F846D5B|nr:hypothetical protein [Sulfuriflexus mobilis]
MKRKMRGIIDPYGISLVLVIIGGFFFEAQQDEMQQAQFSQSVTNSDQAIAQKTTDANNK